MSDAIEATVQREHDGSVLQIWVRDPDLVGKRATLKLERHAKVKRGSPVHKQDLLLEREFSLQAGQNRIALGDLLDHQFSYQGNKLDVVTEARLVVDDGLIFDTTVELPLQDSGLLPPRASAPTDHASVHSPRDRFSFFANLRAIPPRARLTVIWLLLVGLPLILFNAAIGVHDEFSAEAQTLFYDHRGSDGSESPLMKALAGSGAAGLAVWVAIRRQLQKYMQFEARLPLPRIQRGARAAAAAMIDGRARLPLQRACVRVVAYNREHGQYRTTEGSGKRRRTVTREFVEPARAVVLYQRLLSHVPANMPISGFLDGDIDFTPIFDVLYPPFLLGGTHGLSLRLEAQLLHPDLVDHDIEIDPGAVDIADFYQSRG